jgi:hypothetical protein
METPNDVAECCAFCKVQLGEDELHVISVKATALASPGCFVFRIAKMRAQLDRMLTGSAQTVLHLGSSFG